jgi:hypothetical protein
MTYAADPRLVEREAGQPARHRLAGRIAAEMEVEAGRARAGDNGQERPPDSLSSHAGMTAWRQRNFPCATEARIRLGSGSSEGSPSLGAADRRGVAVAFLSYLVVVVLGVGYHPSHATP